jgi:TP901 family phage tail tape measure protein
MAMNMDAAIRIKANVQGANAIQAFSRDLKGLDGVAKLSGAELGRMNIAINRMAREAGNTTAGLRQHISALSNLRERVEIGGKAYNRLGGEIDQLRGKLRALDRDAEKTGGTLKDKLVSGLATVGVGRLTGNIIGKSANFDQEVRKAAAIEGTGSYDALRKSIEGVASVAAGTPTQVAQLATALSRAGFSAKETAQALEGIVMGAEASAVSFEEMGSIAADSMRAFGIDTSKTQQVVDILVKSANSSNQTVLDLGESLKYAAPIARSLGVNINDLAATMAILANNGIRGSEAGTALRSGLSRLQIAASGNAEVLADLTRGSALLSKAMKVLGADVTDARGQLLPLDEVLIRLKKGLANMPVDVQAGVVKALFGEEAGGKLRAALNSTEADIRKMFATIRNSGGAAAETRKEMQGFQNALDRLGGNIETVTNAIGDKFALVLGPLVEGLNITIGALNQMPQPLKDIAAALAAAGIAAVGAALAIKTLGALASVTGIIQTLGLAFTGAAAGVKVFSLALLANPIGLAVAGVVALTVAAYNLSEPFKQFVNSYPQRFAAFWGSLANDATYAVNAVTNAWQQFSGWFKGLWDGIGRWFAGFWDGIKNQVKNALAAIGIDAGWLAGAMGKVVNEITYLWNAGFYQIRKNWRETVTNMINNTNPLFFALKQLGVANVGKAYTDAMFGDMPPAPKRKGNTPNIITAPPVPSGTIDLGAGGADGGAAKAKKAADEAKRALDQYNSAVKSGSDLTRSLTERLQDVNLNLVGIGTNAVDALGVQRLKAELTAAREYGEEMRKIGELEKQRNAAAAKGLSTKDLDARIQAAKELAEALRKARSVEGFEAYTQGLVDLLPKEADYNRQLKESALLAANKKKGIEGLTEVQKLNLQIELLDLEAKAEGNEVLKERIRRLRELAAELDKQKEAQDKTFGESFKDKIKSYYESIKDIGGALGDVAVNAFKGLEDQLTEFVTTGKANFRAFVADILKQLARLAIRLAIIQPLLKGLGNALKIPGFAMGGIMTSEGPAPLKKYARGGIANSPQLAMFGEGSQPEAYVPLPDGRRIPVAMKGGGGTGAVVNVSVDAKGTQVSGNGGQAAALGRVIAQAVQQELIRQKRPGGLIAA